MLDKYYEFIGEEKNKNEFSISEKIVFEIVKDFTNRRGLRQEWEYIDDDIQKEIIKEWISIVEKNISL